jgi:4-hydroxybenzoate polyprenyltransferase
MNIVALVVALILIGAALYIIELLPIDATFKRIIRVVVIVVGLLYVLGALFGGIALPALRVSNG